MSDARDEAPKAADDEETLDAAEGDKSKKGKKAKKVKPPKAPKEKKTPKPKGAKKGIPWVLVLVPVALVAALVLVFALPPTHAMLMKSPLGPLIARLTHESPTKTAAGGKATAAPKDEAKGSGGDAQSDKDAAAQKDAQIAKLQAQVTQLQSSAKVTPDGASASAPDGAPASAPDGAPSPAPTTTAVPDDVKRTAQYWAAMDADKAADIIKQLPDDYVRGVFSQMPPDAVSDIMSELPAKTAARLTAAAGMPTPPSAPAPSATPAPVPASSSTPAAVAAPSPKP
jgi:flagellar motility protein MotE (MotC chaperone)